MGPITPRNRNREGEPGRRQVTPEIYWRRRLFALAAGLAVFGLLAWAVGGAAAHPKAATTASYNRSQPPVTPAGFPTPTFSSASPAISPSVTASPSPTPASSSPSPAPPTTAPKAHAKPAKAAKAAARRPGAKPRSGGLNAPGDDCLPHNVVISLSVNGTTFGATERPQFTVNVVSTAGRRCAFNVGVRYLTLVIESGGVREWGSADCFHGGGTQVAMLSRGVPVQRTITWNRKLSAPGCHLAPTIARPGTYTATVSDSGVRSRTVVFTLG